MRLILVHLDSFVVSIRIMNKIQSSVIYTLISILSLASCTDKTLSSDEKNAQLEETDSYQVAFLIMDGVYNTELTAPFDIFQHTKYRDSIKPMDVFTVANTHELITTFEGIKIQPDYNYLSDEIPSIDILVVPSAEHHLDSDLEDEAMLAFVRKVDQSALYVTSHCDGSFVLAKAGVLDGHASTTFPSDIDAYEAMFPHLEVYRDVLFVHDDKYITSVGGAKSFEAALYLSELLYGPDIARRLAQGLVIDWDLKEIDYLSVF